MICKPLPGLDLADCGLTCSPGINVPNFPKISADTPQKKKLDRHAFHARTCMTTRSFSDFSARVSVEFFGGGKCLRPFGRVILVVPGKSEQLRKHWFNL